MAEDVPIPMVLAIVAVAAVVNWFTRRPGGRPLSPWVEWISKPTVTAGLVIAAATIDVADTGQQRWFVAGLILCLIGDVALMLPTEMFRSGLTAFLLGHLAFVVGFIIRSDPAPLWSVVIGAIVLIICLGIGARHLLPSVRRSEPELFPPVLAYIVVIGSMAVAAWWGQHWAAPLGAAAFAISDLTLADNKFVTPRRWAPLAVMVTYHAALALLVVSLR